MKVVDNPNFFFTTKDGDTGRKTFNSSSRQDATLDNILLYSLFLSMAMTIITTLIFICLIILFILASPQLIIENGCNLHMKIFCSSAVCRFFSLNCNCPCYRTRPHLRFRFRFVYLIICAIMRIILIILFFTLNLSGLFKNLTVVLAISCIFLFLQFLMDYYHYRVLWHYKPYDDNQPRKTLSPKHKRYLPYHLLGHNRTETLGNYPCKNTTFCTNRKLEHIMIFHSTDYQPQPRWSAVRENTNDDIYIGFHQTKPEHAILIAHSDFRRSEKPPQMLGFGIYFARSLKNTFGKARNQGAFICAQIRMGRVKEITRSQLHQVKDSNAWWNEYDTVYLNNDEEKRDEFCIKDSSQIIKWVIAIDDQYDRKVADYGMNKEFADTVLGCC